MRDNAKVGLIALVAVVSLILIVVSVFGVMGNTNQTNNTTNETNITLNNTNNTTVNETNQTTSSASKGNSKKKSSSSDVVSTEIKENYQAGDGSKYKEVTYKDGNIRQYDSGGNLIGSSYSSDQGYLKKKAGKSWPGD